MCSECHMQGIDRLLAMCMEETSANPVEILDKMMSMPFCHMHGPEHHVMVGMAILTAYKNAGGSIELEQALIEMNTQREVCARREPAGSGVPAVRGSARGWLFRSLPGQHL